jgi:hypothetical protein
MPPTHESLQALATSFLSSLSSLSTPAMLAIRAPTCTHVFAPSSLSLPAPLTNTSLVTHLADNLAPLLSSFPTTAKEIHINELGRQITIWATGRPEFKAEVMDGEAEEWVYTGEYIYMLSVDEDGKIVRVLEFLDSKATERLSVLMGRAKASLGMDGKAW